MVTLDDLYRERAHLIAHLAALYPSVMVPDADPETPGWPILYVRLPTGQLSWHLSFRDMDLFSHVPSGAAIWDGHDTAEKYRRLDAHTAAAVTVSVPPRRLGASVNSTKNPRRFYLLRRQDETGVSGTGRVADGVQFTDGTCCLRWLTNVASTGAYLTIDAVREIHGHNGATAIVWIDEDAA